jgi:hypothetical protein
MAKDREGYCRLCGQYGKLSYEHVPPKSAYNDQPIALYTFTDLVDGRGRTKFRQGLGAYTLCVRCNNLTGAWYGSAFAEWTRQGLEGLDKLRASGQQSILLPYYVRPLNVVKQIVIMALALGAVPTIAPSAALRRFVLNREERYLPTSDKLYVYHSVGGQPRLAAGMAVLNIETGSASYVRGEVALPPFGYLVSDPLPQKPDLGAAEGLCEITWFADYAYDEYAALYLRIPGMETNGPVPVDYRTREQMAKEGEQGQRTTDKGA